MCWDSTATLLCIFVSISFVFEGYVSLMEHLFGTAVIFKP